MAGTTALDAAATPPPEGTGSGPSSAQPFIKSLSSLALDIEETPAAEQVATHKPRGDLVRPPPAGHFDALLLGTGVSTAVPILSHVLRGSCPEARWSARKCDGVAVCQEASDNPASRNRRNNVSLLIRYSPSDGSRARHIMIDAGKTMRQAAITALPRIGADSIDALLLTHGHADAILGMDDLRDLQVMEPVNDELGRNIGCQPAHGAGALKVLSNKATLNRVREVFPYVCGKVDFVRPGVLRRRVLYAELEEIHHDNAALDVALLPVRCFPVWHGGTYVSLGFALGRKPGAAGDGLDGHPMLYISDVKEIPPATGEWLQRIARAGIDLLIVDALRRQEHPTHFSLDEAIAFVRTLRPKKTLLIGMASCEIGDHDEVNTELEALLASEGLDIKLAYDGLHTPAFAAGPGFEPTSDTLEAEAKPPAMDGPRRAASRADAPRPTKFLRSSWNGASGDAANCR